jgi:regulatory protein YycH of two-component signal transduction system YycFG
MREYNTVDPLADIKYWWRYEAWPIEKAGVLLVILLFLVLSWYMITFEPAYYTTEKIEMLADRDNYEPMTPDDIARLSPEQIPPPIPINPNYAGYVSHDSKNTNRLVKRKKTSRSGGANFLKKKSERKISSAKHKRSDRSTIQSYN